MTNALGFGMSMASFEMYEQGNLTTYRGAPAGQPFYTVIELDIREDHSTYKAEVAACLAFAGLRRPARAVPRGWSRSSSDWQAHWTRRTATASTA